MKLPLRTAFSVFFFLQLQSFQAASLFAVPVVKIQNTDASQFPIINVSVSVHTGRGLISGLDENDFSVYEDGYRAGYVKISPVQKQEEKLHAVLCIDSSKSISSDSLERLKAAAAEILGAGSPNKTALYGFNDTAELMCGFDEDRASLLSAVGGIKRGGSKTLLYNTIYDALQLLEDSAASGRTVIVFTDGIDDGSSVTAKDVINFAKDTETPVFFLIDGNINLPAAERIAKLSGGQVLSSRSKFDANQFFSYARGLYTVSYHSLLRPDDKKHGIEIRLSSGEVRGRDSGEFFLSSGFFSHSLLRNNLLLYAILALLSAALVILLILAVRQKRSVAKDTEESGLSFKEQTLVVPKTAHAAAEARDDKGLSKYSDAWLIQKNGSETGKRFMLSESETIIGRQQDCGLIIYDNSVSPEHAKIKNVNGVFYLFDLISDGGTFLNGKKLLRPKALYDWDEISIGKAKFIFRGSKAAV